MTNAEHLIENVIFGMKEGKSALEILQEEQNQYMLNDENTGITAEEVVAIACHVVWGAVRRTVPGFGAHGRRGSA